jgi:hypothetical protein
LPPADDDICFFVSPAAISTARACAPVLLTGALLLSGCDLVDVSFPDGGIVIGPRSQLDGAAACAVIDAAPAPPPDAGGRAPGLPPPSPPPSGMANTDCQRELRALGVGFAPAAPMNASPAGRPDIVCMVDDPVRFQPAIAGVTFRPARLDAQAIPIFADCSLVRALAQMAEWLARRAVTDVSYLGIYGCRLVAGTSTLSEHGRGRAFDLGAVRLANGSTYTVLTDWEKDQPSPMTAGGRFLRETVEALYEAGIFNIVLTPDYNAAHANHVHMDLTPGGRLFESH